MWKTPQVASGVGFGAGFPSEMSRSANTLSSVAMECGGTCALSPPQVPEDG